MGAGNRQNSLRRVLCLMEKLHLDAYAPPLAELAQEFQVTTRTIRRDLELLEEVGVYVPRWRDVQKVA
jgi:predicted DNA-binding transcriptional regulator YafY